MKLGWLADPQRVEDGEFLNGETRRLIFFEQPAFRVRLHPLEARFTIKSSRCEVRRSEPRNFAIEPNTNLGFEADQTRVEVDNNSTLLLATQAVEYLMAIYDGALPFPVAVFRDLQVSHETANEL